MKINNALCSSQIDPGRVYDVVIIGAGLSGLNAAFELKDKEILVLEKALVPGGRILTRSQHGIYYDLGSVFAFDKRWVPFDMKCKVLPSSKDIGILHKGSVFFSDSVLGCLRGIGLDPEDMRIIDDFRSGKISAGNLPNNLYKILNSFFQVIHPGDIREYLPIRQGDAFVNFSSPYCVAGNSIVIDGFMDVLKDRIHFSADVLLVQEFGGNVQVIFDNDGLVRSIFAKAVIITVPAPIAADLVGYKPPDSLLASLGYGSGIVVALCFKDVDFKDFSYIVTPDLASSTVMQQRKADHTLFLVYFAGEKCEGVRCLSEDKLTETSSDCLSKLNIGPVGREVLVFSDVHYWPFVGPVIDESFLRMKEDIGKVKRPSERIFISGEYIDVDSMMPYGMRAALNAGKISGRGVRRYLEREDVCSKFRSDYLVRASVFDMADKPVYRCTKEEGDIAFYGLILKANHDASLRDYLIYISKDGLWEYQHGVGVTAEDSALVIEGLYEFGEDKAFLKYSLQRLKELFYNVEHGAFLTTQKGRAPYWKGPSIDATAHIGYLLNKISPDNFSSEIKACAAFVASSQESKGFWRGKWFPSLMITTFYAVRLLHDLGFHDSVDKAGKFILNTQEDDGSWNGSVIDTSAAVLALNCLGVGEASQERAKGWLISKKGADGWKGEPVLYYWFDDGHDKCFYDCVDKGRITSAWAELALKKLEGMKY
ncbi:FAD-dependent oxidoreductase [Candidatus Woesearchaeota archaeon]|nr:FAD-dependent oxidoreductase [Candidatus Woesearchaeota archaeon]